MPRPAQLDQLLGPSRPSLQHPFAPKVMALPPLGDPQSQNGSLVRLGDVLYQFDTTVGEPGSMVSNYRHGTYRGRHWNACTRKISVQVNFSGGAGVFGVLQQNPGILTADVERARQGYPALWRRGSITRLLDRLRSSSRCFVL